MFYSIYKIRKYAFIILIITQFLYHVVQCFWGGGGINIQLYICISYNAVLSYLMNQRQLGVCYSNDVEIYSVEICIHQDTFVTNVRKKCANRYYL